MRTILVACIFLVGMSAYAHHSMTGFDRAKNVALTGTIKQFKWANPHSWIDIEVPNDKGGSDVWSLEMTAPGILARAGWKSTMLRPGDKVTIMAHPLVSGEIGGQFVSVTLANGATFTERGQQAEATPAKP